MSEIPAPVRVKVDGPGGLAAAVPHLFGFHPRESLVLVALMGERRRVVFQLRVDLDDVVPGGVEGLVLRLRHAHAEEAIALVYTDDESWSDSCLPYQELIADLGRVCDKRGPMLTDALLVRSGRWWSYLCRDPACCPPDGTPLDGGVTETEVATVVQLGQVTLPDRQALAATVAPYGGIVAAAMHQAVDRVACELLQQGLGTFTERARAGFAQAAERFCAAPAAVQRDEAALLLVGLSDIGLRDEVAGRCVVVADDGYYPLLHELCRLAPAEVSAPPYTLLAAAAYSRGNGALASIALGHALAADPGYSLARLLDDALRRQLPPALLRKAWRPSTPSRQNRSRRKARRA